MGEIYAAGGESASDPRREGSSFPQIHPAHRRRALAIMSLTTHGVMIKDPEQAGASSRVQALGAPRDAQVTLYDRDQRRDDAIRKSHELMKSWDDFFVGKGRVIRKNEGNL